MIKTWLSLKISNHKNKMKSYIVKDSGFANGVMSYISQNYPHKWKLQQNKRYMMVTVTPCGYLQLHTKDSITTFEGTTQSLKWLGTFRTKWL